jgi:hypothetical protein
LNPGPKTPNDPAGALIHAAAAMILAVSTPHALAFSFDNETAALACNAIDVAKADASVAQPIIARIHPTRCGLPFNSASSAQFDPALDGVRRPSGHCEAASG